MDDTRLNITVLIVLEISSEIKIIPYIQKII
jgi:hypothetical protein